MDGHAVGVLGAWQLVLQQRLLMLRVAVRHPLLYLSLCAAGAEGPLGGVWVRSLPLGPWTQFDCAGVERGAELNKSCALAELASCPQVWEQERQAD